MENVDVYPLATQPDIVHRTGPVERRQPRRPLSVIGADATLDTGAWAEKAGAHATRGRTGSGNPDNDAGNSGSTHVGDAAYPLSTTRTSGSPQRNTGGHGGGRGDNVRLPAISPAAENNAQGSRNLRPSLTPNCTTSRQTPGGAQSISYDRARSYELAKSGGPASTPGCAGGSGHRSALAGTGTGAGIYEASRERKFPRVPNGRVSPLKKGLLGSGPGTGSANQGDKDAATSAAGAGAVTGGAEVSVTPLKSNGWVREQARRLDAEAARNTPNGTPMVPLSSRKTSPGGSIRPAHPATTNTSTTHTPSAGTVALSRGTGATTSKDSPAAANAAEDYGWDAGGYDLGCVLEGVDDILGSGVAKKNASVFPSTPPSPTGKPPHSAVSPLPAALTAPTRTGRRTSIRPTSAATPQPQPQPQQPVATAAPAPLHRGKNTPPATGTPNNATSTTTAYRGRGKPHANGNGAGTGEFQRMPRAENTAGQGPGNAPESPAHDAQGGTVGKTANTPPTRMPPWRVAQQNLTSGPGSKDKSTPTGAAKAATPLTANSAEAATRPRASPMAITAMTAALTGNNPTALRVSPPKNAIIVKPLEGDGGPGSRPGPGGAVSNPTTPSQVKRIKMEATDTSTLAPSMASLSGDPTRISRTVTDCGSNMGSPDDAVYTAMPTILGEVAQGQATLPNNAADRVKILAWLHNVQILSAAPTPLYNATHLRPKSAGQWYPRMAQVPAEMAGEAIELDEKLHNVFTLLRHRQRPLNLAYPPKLPIELVVQNAKRRPRTPRSFYGPRGQPGSKDWYKDALSEAKTVESPDLDGLEKLDGHTKQRGVGQR